MLWRLYLHVPMVRLRDAERGTDGRSRMRAAPRASGASEVKAYVYCAGLTVLAFAAWGAVAAFIVWAVVAGLVGLYAVGVKQ